MNKGLFYMKPLTLEPYYLGPFDLGAFVQYGLFDDSFRYRVIQWLISKYVVVVNISQEGLIMAVLITSVRMSLKAPIFYINRALLILNR